MINESIEKFQSNPLLHWAGKYTHTTTTKLSIHMIDRLFVWLFVWSCCCCCCCYFLHSVTFWFTWHANWTIRAKKIESNSIEKAKPKCEYEWILIYQTYHSIYKQIELAAILQLNRQRASTFLVDIPTTTENVKHMGRWLMALSTKL